MVGAVVYAVASLLFGDITVAELRDVLRRSAPGQGENGQVAPSVEGDVLDEVDTEVPASRGDHELDPRP
jgi:hypothetical protein